MEEMNTTSVARALNPGTEKKLFEGEKPTEEMRDAEQEEPIKCTQVTEQQDPLCAV